DLRLVVAEPEAELPFEDVRQLLVLVLVARDDAALLEVDVRDHHPLGRDQPPAELRVEQLRRQIVPAVVGRRHDPARPNAVVSARRASTVARWVRYSADA